MNSCLLDLIQASTQIIMTVVACVMAYLAWKTYLKEPSQEPEPTESEDRKKITEQLTEFVVFDTSKQTTTLKATSEGLECHLKNKKENAGVKLILT